MKRSWRALVTAALLLGVPAAGWAYVVCTDVVNVYPNGYQTQCKDCNLYDAQGNWTGEITTCVDDPGRGPV